MKRSGGRLRRVCTYTKNKTSGGGGRLDLDPSLAPRVPPSQASSPRRQQLQQRQLPLLLFCLFLFLPSRSLARVHHVVLVVGGDFVTSAPRPTPTPTTTTMLLLLRPPVLLRRVPSAVVGQRGVVTSGSTTTAFATTTLPTSRTTATTTLGAARRFSNAESSSSSLSSLSEEGLPVSMPPPSPTLIDLDAEVTSWNRGRSLDPVVHPWHAERMHQVQHFSQFDRWVVLTDLHCSPDTLNTCLEVLQHVHAAAATRKAGVAFLGDFWHHRGSLRIDCLNAVLQQLRNWTVPLILIPGNHDQVTLGGLLHGLTPLENAYRLPTTTTVGVGMNGGGGDEDARSSSSIPGPLVLSHPTKFRNALFVPHIRDPTTLEAVVQSELAQGCEAFLVHADVTGACMNDLLVSSGGIAPSAFPLGKRLYSGHFHKPHILQSSGRTVEYVGSPYQVSLAEAHQCKALVVLDASQGWSCIERIPLDVGRRHFRVTQLDEFLNLRVVDNTTEEAEAVPAPPELPGESEGNVAPLRSGDRVVFAPTVGEGGNTHGREKDVRERASALRKFGIVVEVRDAATTDLQSLSAGATASAPTSSAPEAEELTTESALRSFLAAEVARGVRSIEDTDKLASIGLELLDELASEPGGSGGSALRSTDAGADLVLTEVSVEGFGPFQGRVTYPLANRGLVLLRGENRDGGSDSNGSGKTSLAMAPLWCLTGSLDSRPSQDSKVSDVLNDSSKAARVTVKGQLNGVPFSLSRSKSSSKTGLVFLLGDEDLTAQSFKETQAMVEERLGIPLPLLGRVIFQGQHSLNGLLEATDTELKDQLSLVVPLSVWQGGATAARKRASSAKKRANELGGMISIRAMDRDKALRSLAEAQSNWEVLEKDCTEERVRVSDELSHLAVRPSSVAKETLSELERRVDEAVQVVDQLQLEFEARKKAHLLTMQPHQRHRYSIEKRIETVSKASDALARDRTSAEFKVAEVQVRLGVLEQSWGLEFPSFGSSDALLLPESCPTCHQPIGEGHTSQHLQDSIRSDASALVIALEQAQLELADFNNDLSRTESERNGALDELLNAQQRLDEESSLWNDYEEEHRIQLNRARSDHEEAVRCLAQSARQTEESARRAQLQAALDHLELSLLSGRQTVVDSEAEVGRLESVVLDLQGQLDREQDTSSTLSTLADVLGPRGVPSFVLRNGVQSLQRLSQQYLDDLSDGSLRLQLSLDAGDRVTRRASVRLADGEYKERSLSSLSGGQWRRCSLALTLGFAHWVSRRGALRPSVLFLDEPLTHLDRVGRAQVGNVLRRLVSPAAAPADNRGIFSWQIPTIVMILQDLAAEELEEAFDGVDLVVKENGSSSLQVDFGR